jgi:pimeloyl-ACP methyl ester carboxylesterase
VTDPTETFVEIRGTRVRVLRAGEGPPLLYLHGSGDPGRWLPALGELAASHSVVRPDHPGFGQSDDDPRIDTVHELAYFYLDFLDELGIGRISIVGSSLGAWIAADLSTIEPDRVEKLVLIGASGLRVDRCEQPDEFVLDPQQIAEHVFHGEELRTRAVEDARSLDENPEALQLYLRNRLTTAHLAWNPYFHDPKLVHRLHRAKAPTVVVWGREDRLVPLEHGRRWEELLPDARLEVVDEAGHLPHVEQPERFLAIVRPFLDGVAVNA